MLRAGTGTARWRASTRCFTAPAGSRADARPVRRPTLLTAKASRAPKRGASHRPAGLGWEQAGANAARFAKVCGKKRHVLVDRQGLLMHAIVHAADIQAP